MSIDDIYKVLNEETIRIEFGKKLKKLRADKGLTQEQIALESGMDRAYISEVENGHKTASIVTVYKIAQAMDIKPAEFFNTDADFNL